jgi:hypothetical protein
VVPSTAATLIGFLFFVAPGLLFDLLAERWRPPVGASAFREISRVGLVSLVCSGASMAVLAALRALKPEWVLDPGRWLRTGDRYLHHEYPLIARTLVLEVLLACAVSLFLYWLAVGRRPRLARNDPSPVLWSIVGGRGSAPETRVGARLFALARTREGNIYQGFVSGIDMDAERDNAMIAFQPPIQFQRAKQHPGAMPEHWDRLAVPLGDVQELWLQWIRTPQGSG